MHHWKLSDEEESRKSPQLTKSMMVCVWTGRTGHGGDGTSAKERAQSVDVQPAGGQYPMPWRLRGGCSGRSWSFSEAPRS